MTNEELTKQIKELLIVWDSSVFVVNVSLKRGKKSVLSIKIDKDGGINLAECTKANRIIGRWLEEQDPFDFSYRLEVSSPGVGYPLTQIRQYKNNIGRTIWIQTLDDQEIKGELLEVEQEQITINTAFKPQKGRKNKSKKKSEKDSKEEHNIRTINLVDIKQAKVIII